MKSFKQFITEKPQSIKGREKGTTYFSSGETVGGKTPEEAVSAAERDAKKKAAAEARKRREALTPRKSGRSKDVLDAADDAYRAGLETPGRGSSGRSGASILDDLLGKPPASDIKPGPKSSRLPSDELKISSKYTPPGTGPRGSSISIDAPKTPKKPPVIKQSEVSQQAR